MVCFWEVTMEDKGLFSDVGLLSATSSVAENIKDFGTDNGVYVEAVEMQNWGPFSFISLWLIVLFFCESCV